MLHNEARKLLVNAWNKTYSVKRLRNVFSSKLEWFNGRKRMREIGSVEARVFLRGCEPGL